MTEQARATRVFVALIAAMTVGALVLMALDKEAITSGAFSLSSYTRLNPIEQVVLESMQSRAVQWDRVEVFYSGTASSRIDQLLSRTGPDGTPEANFHFVICNEIGGVDGQIQYTEKWQNQQLCVPTSRFNGVGRTIRICVVADGLSTLPSDSQLKRAAALIRLFERRFNIAASQVAYPANW